VTERYESLLSLNSLLPFRVPSFGTEGPPQKMNTVGIPFIKVVGANPLGIRVAVLADMSRSRSVALVVAAGVMFHS
jgi:hypothetical protein